MEVNGISLLLCVNNEKLGQINAKIFLHGFIPLRVKMFLYNLPEPLNAYGVYLNLLCVIRL